MGRGDNAVDALRHHQLYHSEGHIEVFGAVVHTRQDVAMVIRHRRRLSLRRVLRLGGRGNQRVKEGGIVGGDGVGGRDGVRGGGRLARVRLKYAPCVGVESALRVRVKRFARVGVESGLRVRAEAVARVGVERVARYALRVGVGRLRRVADGRGVRHGDGVHGVIAAPSVTVVAVAVVAVAPVTVVAVVSGGMTFHVVDDEAQHIRAGQVNFFHGFG